MGILNIDAIASTGVPDGPFCDVCGSRTRLVGIETHPHGFGGQNVRTYECKGCESVLTQVPTPNRHVNALIVINAQASDRLSGQPRARNLRPNRTTASPTDGFQSPVSLFGTRRMVAAFAAAVHRVSRERPEAPVRPQRAPYRCCTPHT